MRAQLGYWGSLSDNSLCAEKRMAAAKIEIQIEGMHCAACARTIEKVLGKSAGVRSATVNFATETCAVEFDPAVVSKEEILQAIRDIGYTPLEGDVEKKKS